MSKNKKVNNTNFTLGICIPVWNRGDLFKICFNSLVKNLNGIEATIWIFDNGSDIKTHKIIEHVNSKRYKVNKVFFQKNMGVPYVANLFSKVIQEDCDYVNYKSPQYVMLMDSDAYFKKPIKDLLKIYSNYYQVGLLSGHDSIEHPAIKTKLVKLNGKNITLKQKENERMITMLIKREEFLRCYPFPHYRNRDVDWEITQWNPNSMMKRHRKIFVASGYVLHLGIDTSTWNKSKQILASDEEVGEVEKILKKYQKK